MAAVVQLPDLVNLSLVGRAPYGSLEPRMTPAVVSLVAVITLGALCVAAGLFARL